MNIPDWVRPGLTGATIGAVGLAIVGFTWVGWVTSNTAAQMASSQSHAAVVNALLPLCIEASKQDPQFATRLVSLKSAMFFERGNMVMKNGWATVVGSTTPNSSVATECANALVPRF